MGTTLVILFILFMYIRKPITLFFNNYRLNYLMGLYNAYKRANTHEEKSKAFELIARNRPLSNDLVGSVYFGFPKYTDFKDEQKITESYLRLVETHDTNSFWVKKYLLNPRYFIKDIFYIPAALFEFLLNHRFTKPTSTFISVLSWIVSLLISVYKTDIKTWINTIIEKFT